MTTTDLTDDTTLDMFTAPNRDSLHWTAGSVTWGELKGWMKNPSRRKACGNYVLGVLNRSTVIHRKGGMPCDDFHRTKVAIATRSAITLDVDHPAAGFETDVQMLLEHAFILHTTYSSTPDHPRYRIIIPLDRPVAPDEYHTAAASVMQSLGEDNFDAGSVQPERYMFKPSESEPGYFHSVVQEGAPAEVETLLSEFQADLSAIPAPKPHKNKRDPFGLAGTIGAFNRAYEDFGHLIEEYDLPYVPSGTDRWQLAGATAAAGMGVVQDGLVFSHHANDPAFNQMCSAFDLARLHLYGHLDEKAAPGTPINRLPSHKAMEETATQDINVVRELVGADFEQEMNGTAESIEQDNWRLNFRLNSKTGTPEDDIKNWDLISKNDVAFKTLYFNELTMSIEADGDLPWRPVTPTTATFDGHDRASLALYIERAYHIRPSRAYLDDLVIDRARQDRRNPVRDYLDGLKWDGVPRVETCLPGVIPTAYTRLVARKAMAAAVARMYEPGIKWDHMLVLYGLEGLGKSRWVELIARGHSNVLGRIGDKDTLLTMQRSWIMTSDEGQGMRQAEFNAQKEFITRTTDTFRMPYDREARAHPRHCVIWGSTNEEAFLRRQEGNRRFLIVRCVNQVDNDALTDEYIDQLWAEAVHIYANGEKLYLDDEESGMASEAREDFTEEDALGGIIHEYIDTPVPTEWAGMSPESRVLWLQNAGDGMVSGTERIDRVCSLQIWVEALGRRYGDHKRTDLLEITAALKALDGWRALPGRHRIAGYGPQVVFERHEAAADDDLI